MSLDNVNHDEAVRFGNEVLRANRRRKILYRILSITMPFILLLFWELLARLGWIDTRFFAMPTQIAIVFWKLIENGQLLNDVTISLSRLLIGFALGGIPGLIVGILLGQSSVIRALLYPIIAAIYPIPKIAVLPLLLFIFGLGEAPNTRSSP